MCKKLECKRCHYELKGTEKYCPICGIRLKNMTKEKAIELLKKDLNGYEALLRTNKDVNSRINFSEKMKALEMAIEVLERTAQEVLVQEQLPHSEKLIVSESEKLFIHGLKKNS